MAGLVPAIHVLDAPKSKDVDARHKAGHDELVVETRLANEKAPREGRLDVASIRL